MTGSGKVKTITHSEQGTQFQVELSDGSRLIIITKDIADSQFTAEQPVSVSIG